MDMRFNDHAFSPGKTVYPLKEGRVIKKGELIPAHYRKQGLSSLAPKALSLPVFSLTGDREKAGLEH